MTLARAMATVGGLTLISRIAGFARDILMAAILGAGPVADAFVVALKLPNLFRRLFAEGAFNVAFVPMVTERLQKQGLRSGVAFASDTLSVMLAVLLPLALLASLAMPVLIFAIAPGFSGRPESFTLAVELTRITFPYLVAISVVSLMGGILNALDRFAPFAAAPILFNLCLILALVGLTPALETAGHALAWGVLAAGIAQLLWLWWACQRAGIRLRLPRPRLSPEIRQLGRLMAPAAVGAGVIQINTFIDTLLASTLPAGAITYLYFADRLYQLPLGVIGIAIGTALLPTLSRQVADRDNPGTALTTQNRAIEYGLLLALPAAAGLIVLPVPILSVLFERGAFGPAETRATALALAAYAVGVPAYVLVKVLATGFFARKDTATPVKIAVACTLLNTAASIVLILSLPPAVGHMGIALATGLTAWVNAGTLAWVLHRRGLFVPDRLLARRLSGQLVAALTMAAVLLTVATPLQGALTGPILVAAPLLLALIAAGATVYFGIAVLAGAVRLDDLKRMARRR